MNTSYCYRVHDQAANAIGKKDALVAFEGAHRGEEPLLCSSRMNEFACTEYSVPYMQFCATICLIKRLGLIYETGRHLVHFDTACFGSLDNRNKNAIKSTK